MRLGTADQQKQQIEKRLKKAEATQGMFGTAVMVTGILLAFCILSTCFIQWRKLQRMMKQNEVVSVRRRKKQNDVAKVRVVPEPGEQGAFIGA